MLIVQVLLIWVLFGLLIGLLFGAAIRVGSGDAE